VVSRDSPLVLVAENRIDRRAQVVSGLMNEGFHTAEAFNGEHCLTRVKSLSPDIVLLNAQMPVTDGFQACREIRSLPQGKHIAVFILSQADDPQLRREAEEAGADAFLPDPLDLHELGKRIRAWGRTPSPAVKPGADSTGALWGDNIAHLGRWEWDIAGDRFAVTPECQRIVELASREGLDAFEDFMALVPEMERWTVRRWIDNAISSGEPDYLGHHIETRDGSLKYVLQHLEPIVDPAGATVKVRGALQDITKLRHGEISIFRLAYYDSLTNLPNRRSFEEKLRREISLVTRRSGKAAILFVDIDDFKRINDTFGHATGDQLLQTIAKRLSHVIRETDLVGRHAGAETNDVARFGGDEFLLLLSDIGKPEDAAEVAERILASVGRPIQVDNGEISVTASIGIAVCPDNGSDPTTLIRNADSAMYESKYCGKNRFHFSQTDVLRTSRPPVAAEGAGDEGAEEATHRESVGPGSFAPGQREPGDEASEASTAASQEQERHRLLRENQRLKQERDILIQAAAIIAKGGLEQFRSPGSG